MLHSSTPGSVPRSRVRNSRKRLVSRPTILNRITATQSDMLIRDYLEALGSPRALSVWMLYRYGEHRKLVELVIDPHEYNDDDVFRRDYAAVKFLSKCAGLRTGIDLEATAITSAEEAEIRCALTNERIRGWRRGDHVSDAAVARLFRAKDKIASILGSFPDVVGPFAESPFEDLGWTPGRTSSACGDELASVHKYASRLDVTGSAIAWAHQLINRSPQWGSAAIDAEGPVSVLSRAFTIVGGNTLITVPKSAKTDRVICYEPHMNIRLQRAVGSWMAHRLSKHGVHLNDQSINQRRARLAAREGWLATIDLSQASDTLARELVFELLPVDWVNYLDQLRSRYTLWPDGSNRRNEKFSSMGNGFTFELESLIFYALASAVVGDVSVYGDDIIFPGHAFDEISDLFAMCGFVINSRKSYKTSYFRESCGVDCFGGSDCTPVYLRKLPTLIEDVVKLHNSVRAWCERSALPARKLSLMLKKWRDIHTNPLGPSGYGDGHYHVDFETAAPQRAPFFIDGWWYTTFTKTFKVNRVYGDRVHGHFPCRLGAAALAAALGPRAVRSAIDSTVDRQQWFYKKSRALASFTWPGIVWF